MTQLYFHKNSFTHFEKRLRRKTAKCIQCFSLSCRTIGDFFSLYPSVFSKISNMLVLKSRFGMRRNNYMFKM